jgi:hypothetical protein
MKAEGASWVEGLLGGEKGTREGYGILLKYIVCKISKRRSEKESPCIDLKVKSELKVLSWDSVQRLNFWADGAAQQWSMCLACVYPGFHHQTKPKLESLNLYY